MADDARETDSTAIDSAINELAERKNDIGSEKPSTSTPKKRPSPNSNDHQLTSKRLNNALMLLSSSSSPPPALSSPSNVSSQSAIKHANDNDDNDDDHDDDDNNYGGVDNESNDIDLFAIVPHKSRSIERTNESIEKMCINSKLMSQNFIQEFISAWLPKSVESHHSDTSSGAADTSIVKPPQQNCTKFLSDSVKLYKYPFQICVMSDFLGNESFTRQLVEEMCHMQWNRKQMDLYEFHQTTDLANLSSTATAPKPALKQFYSLLTTKMLPWMRQITGLSLTRVSASCSMYNYGDYLLVHDDLLADRQIAFVFYLSPWYTEWTEEMGGALELFESDSRTGQPKYPIVDKFSPRNNQFVFFRVCKQSFHQVGEVTNRVYPRLTINGWFHGTSPNNAAEIMSMADSIEEYSDENSMEVNTGGAVTTADQQPSYHISVQDDLDLNDWINPYYLRRRTKNSIHQHIEDKSEASLEMFLIAEFFDTLTTEFKSSDFEWILEGPANQRKYERLQFAPNATGPLKDLYTLFTSESMFELLQEYTELDLSGLNADNPTCSVQLCRFTQGCYTLLGDSTTFADSALDVILFFNAHNGVGKITYLSPSQGVSTEYNTTAETDITNPNDTTANDTLPSHLATDISFAASDISSTSSISTLIKNNASNQNTTKSPKQASKSNKQQTVTSTEEEMATTTTPKSASSSANNSSPQCMDTSDDDVSIDEIQATSTKRTSSNSTAKNDVFKVTVRADVHELVLNSLPESYDTDISFNDDDGKVGNSSSSSRGGGGGGSHHNVAGMAENDSDDDDQTDEDDEELAQEDALLTIHPKNNSLNLVYRLSGQTKFVKYISKNSLKPNEYIYILFASYKE